MAAGCGQRNVNQNRQRTRRRVAVGSTLAHTARSQRVGASTVPASAATRFTTCTTSIQRVADETDVVQAKQAKQDQASSPAASAAPSSRKILPSARARAFE